jgi:hypothetical protein
VEEENNEHTIVCGGFNAVSNEEMYDIELRTGKACEIITGAYRCSGGIHCIEFPRTRNVGERELGCLIILDTLSYLSNLEE